jgi:hypothetical protein
MARHYDRANRVRQDLGTSARQTKAAIARENTSYRLMPQEDKEGEPGRKCRATLFTLGEALKKIEGAIEDMEAVIEIRTSTRTEPKVEKTPGYWVDLLSGWPLTDNNVPRYLCTTLSPKPEGAPGSWAHEFYDEIGEQENGYPGGDIITVKCCSCGEQWKQELPQ